MHICVYGAARNEIHPDYLNAGEELGRCMAQRGHTLVYGGGGNGLMGAVARGMHQENGEIIAVVPRFFNVDGVLSPFSTETLFTDTMRERKQLMETRSDAFVMTPGGLGTFDEFFEILTLRSLGRHSKPIAILNTRGYFDSLCAMVAHTIDEGFATADKRSLFAVFSAPTTLLDYLEKQI